MTRLTTAIVARLRADDCEVLTAGGVAVAGYGEAFRPKASSLAPGHLVALDSATGSPLVLWRWFDALVLSATADEALVWEPFHGEVTARRRHPGAPLAPGSRAYVSAGLPGADWWLAGAACDMTGTPDVELAEVGEFYTRHELWPAAE